MTDSKYGKYFLTHGINPEMGTQEATEYTKWATRLTWINDKVIPGAFYFACSWYYRPPDRVVAAHTHDFNEILGFYGSDPQNPRNLGGEVEFWLEDEKYILTESFLVFIMAFVCGSCRYVPFHFFVFTQPSFSGSFIKLL